MIQGKLSNKWKAVISIEFSISQLLLPTSLTFQRTFRNAFRTHKKVVSHISVMANPNPSTFLSKFSRNIVKEMKNRDFHSIFHIATELQSCLTLLNYIQEYIWNLQWSVVPWFWYGQSKSINIFRHFSRNISRVFSILLLLLLFFWHYIQECI